MSHEACGLFTRSRYCPASQIAWLQGPYSPGIGYRSGGSRDTYPADSLKPLPFCAAGPDNSCEHLVSGHGAQGQQAIKLHGACSRVIKPRLAGSFLF